jgi:hypothetical protein
MGRLLGLLLGVAAMLAAAAELKLVERALWRLSPRAIRA